MSAHSREKAIFRATWVGSIVNFLLLVFKFIAGILGLPGIGLLAILAVW